MRDHSRFPPKRFTLTETHVKLLRHMNVRYDDEMEFGAPEIDPKRPYGNSGVYADLHEIIGGGDMNDDLDEATRKTYLELHKETATALQVVLASGSFEPGVYEASTYGNDWRRAAE